MHIETKKDKASIESLFHDIIRALTRPPIRRLESNFSGRADALRKRLSNRIDPASPASTFPLPVHQLFPEQSSFNSVLVGKLSSELNSTRKMLNEVGDIVKVYRSRCEAIEEAESVLKDMSEIRRNLSQINDRLENGFLAYDGDGSPPDLNHPTCVDPLRFSAYLAMLPTTMEQIAATQQSVVETVRRARLSVLHMEKTQADDTVKEKIISELGTLEKDADATEELKSTISEKVSTLRDVRRIWSTMDEISKSLDVIAEELRESLLVNRWKQETGGDSGPLTPESSQAALPVASVEASEVEGRLSGLGKQIDSDLNEPVLRIKECLPDVLRECILERQKKTQRYLRDLQNMNGLLFAIRTQTASMECVRDDAHALESRIEEAKMAYDQCLQDIVSFSESEVASQVPSFTDGVIRTREESLGQIIVLLQRDVEQFVNSLATRVPFISRRSADAVMRENAGFGVVRAGSDRLEVEDIESTSLLPFDLAAIDRVVRNDSNAYSLLLMGSLRSLLYKQSILTFFKSARTVSKQLADLGKDLIVVHELLNEASDSFTVTRSSHDDNVASGEYLDSISSTKNALENVASVDTLRVSTTISEIRDLMNGMRTMPGLQDDVNHLGIFTSRCSKLDELDLRWHRIVARLELLRGEVNNAYQNEMTKLQREAEVAQALDSVEKAEREQEETDCRKRKEEAERKEREEASHRKKLDEEAIRNEETKHVLPVNRDGPALTRPDDGKSFSLHSALVCLKSPCQISLLPTTQQFLAWMRIKRLYWIVSARFVED